MRRLSLVFVVSAATLALAVTTALAIGRGRTTAIAHTAAAHATHRRPAGPAKKPLATPTSRSSGTSTGTSLYKALASFASAASNLQSPLLGDQSVETARDTTAPGLAKAFAFTARASGTATTLHLYLDSASKAGRAYVGVFSAASGQPAKRIAVGSRSQLQPRAWNTFSVSPAPIVAGQVYWVAVLGEHGTIAVRDRASGSCHSQSSAQANLSSLPSSWSGGRHSTACPISAYVTGTLSAVTASAPTNKARPQLSGATVQGQTLATTTGTWNNKPTSYHHAWKDCDTAGANCTTITGASNSSYTLTSSDVGHTVVAVVTATNSTRSASATTSPSTVVTAATTASTTASTTTTFMLGNKTLQSVQDGGTGTSEAFGYTASASGTAQGIKVYLASTDGVSLALYADNSGKPGARLDSGTVTSNSVGWVNISLSKGVQINQGTRYWLAIAAKSSSAAVTYYDSGTSSSNLDYSGNGLANPYSVSGHWNSNPASVYLTGTLAPATPPSNTALPSIPAAPQQGTSLSASAGTWSGTAPMTYTYQWQDAGQNISGATSQSYVPSASDVGKTLDVMVTASNSAGSASAASAQSTVVSAPPPLPAPSNTGLPAISGSPVQGQALSTTNGTWNNSPTGYAYQWQDCDSSGANCTNITGATSSSYTPVSGDVGHTLVAVVTATNATGSTPASSKPTAAVSAPSSSSGSTSGSGMYQLPADRMFAWNPGLNAVGGIPARTAVYQTISPSGGDDTATIQAALDSCPTNGVVQLTAGVFHISGQGLSMERSYCTLRGVGPGPGNFSAGQAPADGTTTGTYLVKAPVSSTGYPVAIIGPRWGGDGTATNLTQDGTKGAKSVTVASTAGLSVGGLVVVDELTDPNLSHWNSQDPENASGWFEEPNRPLGDVLEIASISGNTVTFTTPLPITYQVSQSAHLYPLTNVVKDSGIENLYVYGGQGGDGGGGLHLWNCENCWVKHVEDTWSVGAAIHIDSSFGAEVRDSYFHDSQQGLNSGGANYGIGLNWYTSNSLIENNIVIRFNKVDVMRSAGGGNVFGYNYMDDGADLNGQWFETNLNSSHMTTPHYELFEGNEAANFDQDDRWGNSIDITIFRNDLTGFLRDFPTSGPLRAAGLTQWHWWQSFVGNVLGTPSHPGINTYEGTNGGDMWMLCWQNNDNVPDGGKCLSTQLRDGNFDYLTGKVHWHGIGGTGANNGLTPPANATLPASMYLTTKPAFFGTNPWPWVDGSNATNPLPGPLPARQRYDAGTPNATQ